MHVTAATIYIYCLQQLINIKNEMRIKSKKKKNEMRISVVSRNQKNAFSFLFYSSRVDSSFDEMVEPFFVNLYVNQIIT